MAHIAALHWRFTKVGYGSLPPESHAAGVIAAELTLVRADSTSTAGQVGFYGTADVPFQNSKPSPHRRKRKRNPSSSTRIRKSNDLGRVLRRRKYKRGEEKGEGRGVPP